ncbi:MAG: methyltransferase, TIGR04325 family [Rhodocyclaceae bacterium]|nr:MAG: methyltransferase, TIGR04325 family [Rhodocyclaceae bacterium]
MQPLYRVHRWIEWLTEWPPLQRWLSKRYEREFANNRRANLFRGVFDSFSAAAASAPKTRPLGYDNAVSAKMYQDRTNRTFPTDYPILFWLSHLLASGSRTLVEIGGHIGVSYYAYRKQLAYPSDLHWVIHDVPAVIVEGRKQALERDLARQLTFQERFEACPGADVLLAQGALQYLLSPLPDLLSSLPVLPPHLLLNMVPLHDMQRPAYFTLQSIGTAFCPYRIEARGCFVQSIEALGYMLVDRWENPDKACQIPFHPRHSVDRYEGFYFALTTPT